MRRYGVSILLFVWIALFGAVRICAMGNCAKGMSLNLLLITIDTLRADHLSCYGYQDIATPTIDRLASEGVLFSYAFTPVPITLPSHVSIMTGRYPLQHGIRSNGNFILEQDAVTLAEVLKAQGYRTGACVGAFVLDSLFGLDQGFDYYDDSLPKKGAGATLLENERRAEAVTRTGLDWLKENGDRPFFLWLHYFDPHAIYLPPSPFDKEYKGHLYDGEIAYTDKCIGDLLDGIKAMGLVERTVICLTADHGEGLGEHGEPTHAIFLYDSTLHVPLIIRTPLGILPHGKVDAMVSTIDIFPTVLDLLSVPIEKPDVPSVAGKSVIPLIIGKAGSLHEEILCESLYPELSFGWSRVEGIRTSEWEYIMAPRPELYHLSEDPKQERNVYSKDAACTWQKRLKRLKGACGPERDSHVGLDDETRGRLEGLGYIWSTPSKRSGERPDPKAMITLLDGIDRGVSYIYLGFYDKACMEFKKILKTNPDNASALFYLASAEERLGNLEEAEHLFRAVLALSSHYLDVRNHLGVIYHRQGKLDKAIEEFALALKQTEYPEIYYNLSVVHSQKGHLNEAMRAAEMALALDPKYADALNQLGQIAIERGEFDQAKGYLDQALKIEHDHLEAHNNLGVVYYREGMVGEALREFEKALSIDPNNSEALNNLGGVYLSQGDYKKAEEAYKRAVYIRPYYLEGLINLGSVYFHKKEYSHARELYLKAIELDPACKDIWTHLGLLFLTQGEYALAKQALDKALQIGPESTDIYIYIGQVYLGLNQQDEAINSWEKAISLDATNPVPLMNMATVKFQVGEYDSAIALWEKVLEMDHDLDEPFLHIGTAYLRMNRVDNAINAWEKLLARRPNHPDAMINLGTAFYQKGDLDGAIRFWQKAEVLDSENPKIHYNLGLALFCVRDYKDSIDQLKEALRLEPNNKDVLTLLMQVKKLYPGQG